MKVRRINKLITSSAPRLNHFKTCATQLGYVGAGLISAHGQRWNIWLDAQTRLCKAKSVSIIEFFLFGYILIDCLVSRWLISWLMKIRRASTKLLLLVLMNGRLLRLWMKFWVCVFLFPSKFSKVIFLWFRPYLSFKLFILQCFLQSTKKMEGDGPTGASVLFQYSGLILVLVNIKQTTPHQGLSDMIGGMINQLREYQTESLHFDPIIMATILNPRLWLEYFKNKYSDYAARAEDLFRQIFSQYEKNNPLSALKTTHEANHETDWPFDPLDKTNVFGTSATIVLSSDNKLNQYFLLDFSV